MRNFIYFLIAFIISVALYFPVNYFGKKFNIVAQENERTIHHGKIVRVGGICIYISFMIVSLFVFKHKRIFDGLLLGSTVIFIFGLLDDIYSLKPIIKLLGQFLAATCAIFVGDICLTNIHLFFGIVIESEVICIIITYLWIMGICNAINLIDGLDGLAAGFTIIVSIIVALLSTVIGNSHIMVPICTILIGSTLGFLIFNFHPAKIFMGDCGSQLLGFIIASISLFGFRKATLITLSVPILLLFIPIMDTLLAIIRRKIHGQGIMSADKGHLHHMLMNKMKLGQVGAVIVIYIATALLGLNAYIYILNWKFGLIMFIVILIIFDLFIEYTEMISEHYKPLLTLFKKLKK